MQIIRPENFNPYNDDAMRNRWTKAQLEAMVEAFDGRKVHVETDTMTGHISDNVELVDVRPGRNTGYDLALRDTYTEKGREVQRVTCYPLYKIGAIIDPAFPSASWAAHSAYSYHDDPETELARDWRASRATRVA
jgi:hypothetical protein